MHILERSHLEHASLVVVTIPDETPASETVRSIRKLNPTIPVIARAHRTIDRDSLLRTGANEVIQPEIEASAVLVSSALRYLPVSRVSAEAFTQALRSGLENAPVPVSGDFPITREIAVGDFENDGESLAEARVRERFGVTVVTVNSPHGDVLVNPPAGTTIKSGDKLRVFGLPKQIAEFQAYLEGTATRKA
jgi:Trk K+ transport system NAD-binding subunit